MLTHIRFMRILSGVLLAFAVIACSAPSRHMPDTDKIGAWLHLNQDHKLTFHVNNGSASWMVFENLIDVADDGWLNTEHLVLKSGTYVGKTAGPSVACVLVKPGGSFARSVDLAKNYEGLARNNVLSPYPLRLSCSLFASSKAASRFVTELEDSVNRRRDGYSSASPTYNSSIQVTVRIGDDAERVEKGH